MKIQQPGQHGLLKKSVLATAVTLACAAVVQAAPAGSPPMSHYYDGSHTDSKITGSFNTDTDTGIDVQGSTASPAKVIAKHETELPVMAMI